MNVESSAKVVDLSSTYFLFNLSTDTLDDVFCFLELFYRSGSDFYFHVSLLSMSSGNPDDG
ncbi:hypothetical protein D3C86_1986130 [compost metagenome]